MFNELSVNVMEAVTAIPVRLVDWHDTGKSTEVVASSFKQLRSMVRDTAKLYFYDVRDGRPRGTDRVKLTGDSEFDLLKLQPADTRPVTVYFYAQRDGDDPDSPPRGEPPRVLSFSDTPKSSSSRSTTVLNLFRDNLESRYLLNNEKVVCQLCGKAEGELRFEACHIIPYSCKKTVFRDYGLINGKIDGLNGVFFCHECHQYYDNGHWKWTIQDDGEQLAATVVVSEGLQEKYQRWKSLHGTVVKLGKGPTYPSIQVWEAGYRLNFSDPSVSRKERRETLGPRCVMCGKHYKSNYQMHGCDPPRRKVLFHTPRAEHAPRSGRGGRGRTATGRGGRSNAVRSRTPPLMAAIQGASPPSHLTASASSEPRRSARRQPVDGANIEGVRGGTRKIGSSAKQPTGSQSEEGWRTHGLTIA
jgi:hypothetical protein